MQDFDVGGFDAVDMPDMGDLTIESPDVPMDGDLISDADWGGAEGLDVDATSAAVEWSPEEVAALDQRVADLGAEVTAAEAAELADMQGPPGGPSDDLLGSHPLHDALDRPPSPLLVDAVGADSPELFSDHAALPERGPEIEPSPEGEPIEIPGGERLG